MTNQLNLSHLNAISYPLYFCVILGNSVDYDS